MPGTVEKTPSLDIRDLKVEPYAYGDATMVYPYATLRWSWLLSLRVNRWCVELLVRGGESWQHIRLVWTDCNFGGLRPRFACPTCKRRARKLFEHEGRCACRRCADLRYASQRCGARSRRFLQACKLRLRLGSPASIAAPFPARPPRMHRRTYLRLRERAERLERDLSRGFQTRKPDYTVLVPK
jgi:hypothetical protein